MLLLPEGLRRRLLGADRGGGDRQRRAGLPRAAGQAGPAHRADARRTARADAGGALGADPPRPRGPARRGDGAGPAHRRRLRHRVGVLHDQRPGRAGAGAGRQHQLRRPPGADEPARPGPPPAAPVRAACRAPGLPLRGARAGRTVRAAAGRGAGGHPAADPAVRHRGVHRLHRQPGRPGPALGERAAARLAAAGGGERRGGGDDGAGRAGVPLLEVPGRCLGGRGGGAAADAALRPGPALLRDRRRASSSSGTSRRL